MIDTTTLSASIAAATLAVGEALKRLGVPSKFIPYANAGVAVLVAIIMVISNQTEGSSFGTIITSLLSAFAAGGIYDLVKLAANQKQEVIEEAKQEGKEELIEEIMKDEEEG